MLNIRMLPESNVGSSNGPGLLSLGLKSLKGLLKSEEKLDEKLMTVSKRSKSLLNAEDSGLTIAQDLEEPSQTKKAAGAMSKNLEDSQKLEYEKLRTISLDEIAWHDTPDDCWFAIYDYVYDCTSFIKNHPGGDDVLLEYAGRDATLAFIGAGHSKFAQKALERYLVGELPVSERIFRVDGGVKVYGV